MNQTCCAFFGASKSSFDGIDGVGDVFNQPHANLTVASEDPGRAALSGFGDDLP